LPTDTFYAAWRGHPVNLHAVEQIYQIKTRQKHKPFAADLSLAQAYDWRATPILCSTNWPTASGPARLTIIVRAGTKRRCAPRPTPATWRWRVPDAGHLRARWWERFGLPITALRRNLQGASLV